MLGHKLSAVLASCQEFEVHASSRGSATANHGQGIVWHRGIDARYGSAQLQQLLESIQPNILVNAIGAVKQRNLSRAPEETLWINGTLPHLLAYLSTPIGAQLIHFSTDCVFAGDRGNYRESDIPDAHDLYGRSKALGEIDYERHLTIRTSIIGFEIGGHLGLISWLFRQRLGTSLNGYTRAVFSGLPTVSLSRIIRDLLRSKCAVSGLYHVASEPISKYDLLRRICERFRLDHEVLEDPSVKIDRSLDDSRFRSSTGTSTPNWDSLIEDLYDDYVAGKYEHIYDDLRQRPS
jgi:dTDP-4-dehydrorhamnose reductase